MARKPPSRARTERRAQERALRKAVRQTEKDVQRAPGGAPDHPLVVPSASVVEPRARETRCAQCGGDLELRTHAAEKHAGEMLRVARLVCRVCHAPRTIWFRIEAPLAN